MEHENKLTNREINYFRHGLPGHARIMTALKWIFAVSGGVWLLFLTKTASDHLRKGKSIATDLGLLLMWAGLAALMCFCVRSINKRNDKIYHMLKNGEYKLIVTKIEKKEIRYLGSGRNKSIVYFYQCSGVRGEVTPVFQKQYKNARPGDDIKVILIDKLYVAYGIAI